MIFLTVGTQLPFDRLVKAVDEWAATREQDIEIFGQIGLIGPENYRPKNFEWSETIDPEAFRERAESARLIVGHAGMGTLITAMTYQTPVLVMARLASLGEHRNEHQSATVAYLSDRPGVTVAKDETDLKAAIPRILMADGTKSENTISPFAEDRLIATIRNFIHTGR